MKFSAAIIASAVATVSLLPEQADAHAFLLLPKADIKIAEKNFYAYVVPGEKVPPFSSYTTGNADRNSQGFTTNYKKLNPSSLKDFILKNEVPATGSDIKPGGTPECGYSNPNASPQPIPDHIEFGNYNLQISGGLHPGPCEAWCDDEIVVPFTEDCRTRFQKPIQYDKSKCVGKSRFTFYWLATHFAPFQVYIGCAPLQGGSGGGAAASSGGGAANRNGANSTASAGGNNGGNNGGSGNANLPTGGNNNNNNNNGGNNNNNNNNNNGGNNNNNNGGNNNNNNGGNNNNNRNNNNNGGNNNNNNGGNNNNNNNNNNRNNNGNNQNKAQGNNGRSLDFSALSN